MKLCRILGIPVINRSRKTCKWATEFCRDNCYNTKLYSIFGHTMLPTDKIIDREWSALTADMLKEQLTHIKTSNGRIRLMARGEAFTNVKDVIKVKSFMITIPEYLFWIPTRAWRNDKLRRLIEIELKLLPNARITASIDPSNTQEEIDSLKESNWSTMFFGNNSAIERRIKCPKTWLKERGGDKMHRICRTCPICFGSDRVDVHLKKH